MEGDEGGTSWWIVLLAVAVVLAIAVPIVTGVVLKGRTYRIPSAAMAPTLNVGDRVLTTRTSEPRRGDVIVFEAPAGAIDNRCGAPHSFRSPCPSPTDETSDETFVKRVVGLPGERITIVEGRTYVDGERQDEPFINEATDLNCEVCNLPQVITIPPDHYFVMGDNRGESADSREWGPVREDWIVGEVRLRYWPPGDFGTP